MAPRFMPPMNKRACPPILLYPLKLTSPLRLLSAVKPTPSQPLAIAPSGDAMSSCLSPCRPPSSRLATRLSTTARESKISTFHPPFGICKPRSLPCASHCNMPVSTTHPIQAIWTVATTWDGEYSIHAPLWNLSQSDPISKK